MCKIPEKWFKFPDSPLIIKQRKMSFLFYEKYYFFFFLDSKKERFTIILIFIHYLKTLTKRFKVFYYYLF